MDNIPLKDFSYDFYVNLVLWNENLFNIHENQILIQHIVINLKV